MERLCGSCASEGRKTCWFRVKTDEIIAALPLSEKQTPIAKGFKITEEVSRASIEIAANRDCAREQRKCPEVNYNPQSPKFQPNL